MQYFNFERLINKYATTFTVEVPSSGEYDEFGDYKALPTTKQTLTGAIISHRMSKVFRSEGTLTMNDRALFMSEALPEALQGALVYHEGKTYRVDGELDNASYTGVYAYVLKYQSAFDEGAST